MRRFRLPLLPLALLALGGCAPPRTVVSEGSPGGTVTVHPAIQVRERTTTYPVVGATEEAIRRSLDHGAIGIDGRRYRGLTDWRIRWRFRYERQGSRCSMARVDVRLEITTTLPRWEPPPEVDPGLEEKWRRYRITLEEHEAGHRDRAVLAANEILRSLRAIRDTDCRSITARANERGHEIVRRYHEENRRYDHETRHGRAQGAVWPPIDPPRDAP